MGEIVFPKKKHPQLVVQYQVASLEIIHIHIKLHETKQVVLIYVKIYLCECMCLSNKKIVAMNFRESKGEDGRSWKEESEGGNVIIIFYCNDLKGYLKREKYAIGVTL